MQFRSPIAIYNLLYQKQEASLPTVLKAYLIAESYLVVNLVKARLKPRAISRHLYFMILFMVMEM